MLCSALTIWLVIRLGRRWFNPEAGWWAGMAFAVAPLGVYYGRTFQAESLLILCAALTLEAHSIWVQRHAKWAIVLSWLAFTLAALIKVLPLLWLGLPLLLVQITPSPQAPAEPIHQTWQRLLRLVRKPSFWAYALTSLITTASWYLHAYQLGEASGLTFGFWGNTGRSDYALVFSLTVWIDLFVRMGIRAFAIAGVPFFMIGAIRSQNIGSGRILISGLTGFMLCTIYTMQSSVNHGYYQLPLLLYGSLLIGTGWQLWSTGKGYG